MPAFIRPRRAWAAAALLTSASLTMAAPVTYAIDPTHTYPSFEADHMGISVWRGKLTKTEGTVLYDKATATGWVDIKMDMASIDFGQRQLNAWARSKDFIDPDLNPYATYKGRFDQPVNGVPTQVRGELTLNGRTRPVTLTLLWLRCVPHPLLRRELCGADAQASFDRADFGLGFGKEYGFKTEVQLRIQVEALAQD